VNGETGIRGYAATRDPLFLAPYNLMLTRIGAERKALQQAAVIAELGEVLDSFAWLKDQQARPAIPVVPT